MSERMFERISAHWSLDRKDWVRISLFAFGHPALSIQRAVYDYVRGIGPAAAAAGRAGVSLRPRTPTLLAA